MKIKIVLAVLLGLSALAFVFKSSEKEINNAPIKVQTTGGFNDNFYVGALTCGSQTNYSQYAPLGFNLWSCYRGFRGDIGWTQYSGLENDIRINPVYTYEAGLKSLYNNNLTQYGMRTLMDRTKITYLGYGARSDYQCETQNYLSPELQDYWFYTYSDHNNNLSSANYTDYTAPNIGVKGRYSTPYNSSDGGITYLQHSPGYVVKSLKCNREQACMNQGANSDWIDDYRHMWKIKPRIRIDAGYASNQANWENLVCRVDIVKWEGDTLKSVYLKVKNFLDANDEYNGAYLETYRYYIDNYGKLEYGPGDSINPLRKPAWDWGIQCNIDFRVWWYGNCEMWIDRIRVEDEIASDLFADPPNSNTILYNQWIQGEVSAANDNQSGGGPLIFYMEEWEFNHLPCMKYIADKLKTMPENTNGYGLMACLNYGRMFYHIPPGINIYYLNNQFTDDGIAYVKEKFIKDLDQKQIYMGSYPFEGYEENGIGTTPIPNTLPCGNVTYNPSAGMLTTSIEPAPYDLWLQNHFESPYYVSFIKYMQTADRLSKECNTSNGGIPFVNLVQTHLHYNACEGCERRREPTNEELNLMVNLGLTYEAKSNLYIKTITEIFYL